MKRTGGKTLENINKRQVCAAPDDRPGAALRRGLHLAQDRVTAAGCVPEIYGGDRSGTQPREPRQQPARQGGRLLSEPAGERDHGRGGAAQHRGQHGRRVVP